MSSGRAESTYYDEIDNYENVKTEHLTARKTNQIQTQRRAEKEDNEYYDIATGRAGLKFSNLVNQFLRKEENR